MAKCIECEHYCGIILACRWPYPKDAPFWADSQHRIADPTQLHDCKAFLQRENRLIKERLEDFLRDLLESRDAIITVEDAE